MPGQAVDPPNGMYGPGSLGPPRAAQAALCYGQKPGAAHPIRRSTIICLTCEIALAGFRPLGQVWAQFMIVWQR
jgi:hypothetical protein